MNMKRFQLQRGGGGGRGERGGVSLQRLNDAKESEKLRMSVIRQDENRNRA